MRSKLISPAGLILLATSVYILSLAAKSDLGLYIHPRYSIFTIAMSVICCLLVILHQGNDSKTHRQHFRWYSYLPIFLVLIAAVFLPAKSLSSATASQRRIADISSAAQRSSKSVSTLFVGSSRALSLNDWSRLLATNSDESYYTNKTAKVSGFVFDADLGDDTVWLARFIVTCCAVDAQPIGVPVRIENWSTKFNEDQWLEVDGTFKKAQTSTGEELVLIPTNIEKISEPDNPYAN